MSNTIDFTSMITCSCCGQLVSIEDTTITGYGDHVCNKCLEENYIRCAWCNEYHLVENITEIDGTEYCEECRDRRFVQCPHCDEWIRRYDTYTVHVADGITEEWCFYCRIHDATRCEECDEYFSDSDYSMEEYDGDTLCPSCYKDKVGVDGIAEWIAPRGVQNYGYKPTACFCPDRDDSVIYYGYELEMESNGEPKNHTADTINDTLGYTYCKSDGSLDNGIEVVSHPATLDYHMSLKSTYEKLFAELIDKGWTSHDAGTCGLHVHISKDAMEARNSYAIANLLLFFDNHWNRLVKFSRRTNSQLDRWAQRYSTKYDRYDNLQNRAESGCSRYMAVNLQNNHTVEIRMFRGTLNLETFFATLQLVHVLVEKAIELGCDFDAANTINWNDLVRSDYEELNAYLEKRGLLNVEDGNTDIGDESEPEIEEEDDEEEEETPVDPMERHGFRIGDRVALTIPDRTGGYNQYLYDHAGETIEGTVVGFDDGYQREIGVSFDKYLDGMHNCYGICDNGQWCRTQDLAHIHPRGEEDIGRRVRFNSNLLDPGQQNFTHGIIRTATYTHLGVEIEGYHGHNCAFACPESNGWWFAADNLILMND